MVIMRDAAWKEAQLPRISAPPSQRMMASRPMGEFGMRHAPDRDAAFNSVLVILFTRDSHTPCGISLWIRRISSCIASWSSHGGRQRMIGSAEGGKGRQVGCGTCHGTMCAGIERGEDGATSRACWPRRSGRGTRVAIGIGSTRGVWSVRVETPSFKFGDQQHGSHTRQQLC